MNAELWLTHSCGISRKGEIDGYECSWFVSKVPKSRSNGLNFPTGMGSKYRMGRSGRYQEIGKI